MDGRNELDAEQIRDAGGFGEPGFDLMVPERGLEPPLPCENQVLNLARLPVPPFGHYFDSTLLASLSAMNGSPRTNSVGQLCCSKEPMRR
jgi:hypothetical protein